MAKLSEVLTKVQPVLGRITVWVCLRQDLIDEFRDAEENLAEAVSVQNQIRESGTGRNAGKGSRGGHNVKELAQRVKDAETAIDETAILFTIQATPGAEFEVMKLQHPPRQGDIYDQAVGYDREAVTTALIRPSIVEPEVDTDEAWEALMGVMNPAALATLKGAVTEVNGMVRKAPKSELADRFLTRKSAG